MIQRSLSEGGINQTRHRPCNTLTALKGGAAGADGIVHVTADAGHHHHHHQSSITTQDVSGRYRQDCPSLSEVLLQ